MERAKQVRHMQELPSCGASCRICDATSALRLFADDAGKKIDLNLFGMLVQAPAGPGMLPTGLQADYEELCNKLRKLTNLSGTMELLGCLPARQTLETSCSRAVYARRLAYRSRRFIPPPRDRWDEQVMMPEGAEEARGNQKAALAGVVHEAKVDKEIGTLCEKLWPHRESLGQFGCANVREAKERWERASRMSAELASRAALLETKVYGAWVLAREKNDYPSFAPLLQEMLALQMEICRVTKPEMSLYDAAIDSFDPRMKDLRLAQIFKEVKENLAPLIRGIAAKVGPTLSEFLAKILCIGFSGHSC
jgi:hypothetical protein